MDKVSRWYAICTDCGHEVAPRHNRDVITMEILIHKARTDHRMYLVGEVTKEEVKKCGGLRAVAKLM